MQTIYPAFYGFKKLRAKYLLTEVFMFLKRVTDADLLSELKVLVCEERKLLKQVLEYLEEVESRKLYLKEAYSSLFAFCTEYLGYIHRRRKLGFRL